MKYILSIVFFFQWIVLLGQETAFPIAQIVDSVVVKNSNGETFSLYLPSEYDPNKLAKVIFVFDPLARGSMGVTTFKAAAEKYNYVLVCSNDSKNGPYELNFAIANRLFEDVFSRFNIDKNRIYTAGFSGGSRLAVSIAILTNQMAGVIACGAGFAQQPHLENKFSYVGLVGDEDMNYQEMHSNATMLENLNIPNALITYKDGHSWPPEVQIERALAWLELQAMKKGFNKRDDDFLKSYINNEIMFANNLLVDKPFEAVVELSRTVKDIQQFIDVDSLTSKIHDLKKNDNYIKTSLKVREIEKLEYQLTEMFLSRFRAESLTGKTEDNFEWWKTELEKLHKHQPEKGKIYEEKMFKRIRYRLFAMAIENSNVYRGGNKWNQANYCDKLLTLMLPDNPIWYYRLATSYAQLENLSATLKYLKQAIKLGLENQSQISKDPSFTKFRNEKRFIRLLESLQLN